MNKIFVIGIGYRPLDKRAEQALMSSDTILANNRLMDVFEHHAEYETVRDRIRIINNVYETINYMKENYRSETISLLASGDPMFFGIGRMAVEKLGREAVEVFPDLSSIQVAFSRIKEASSGAFLMTLHGGPDPAKRRKLDYDINEIPALLERHNKIGILTDKQNNPSAIAEAIQSSIINRQSSIRIYVCEKLGYEDERITEGLPSEIIGREFEHPNVVILIKEELSVVSDQLSDIRFGLRETEIRHLRGLITKDEVRAVILHKLRLPEKGVLWDIGAGSGSISIEAARMYPLLKVKTIEKKTDRIEVIKDNILKFGIPNLELLEGEAPDNLKNLPVPDRVFIGGSEGRLEETVGLIAKSMKKGIIIISAATLETLNEAIDSFEENGFEIEISQISVSRAKTLGTKRQLSGMNPIFIIRGEKS